MNLIYLNTYNLFRAIKSKIDKKINIILIPLLVKYGMVNMLCLLLIFNLKKINKIKPKQKTKYKAIVLSKSGGTDDLICSQIKYNKDIEYLQSYRSFFKNIYYSISNTKNIEDIKNFSAEKTKTFKKEYLNFLIKFLKILKQKYKINAFIGFNYIYFAEKELHEACSQVKIPFLLLYKETVLTEIEKKYLKYVLTKTKEKFNGYKIAVYSNFAKKILSESKFVNKNKIEVVGCSRLSESFSFKKKLPKNQILYYAIQNDRGLPNRFIKQFGNKFFKDLKCYKYYNSKYSWKSLHVKTLKILKKFAINNPETLIIIKNKTGISHNTKQYLNLPINMKIKSDGIGHQLLERSKVVVAWNTTSIIEGIAANRLILLPYFHTKNNDFKKENELTLKLKNENYGYSNNDFYKKLDFFMKKKYKNNQIYNNQYSLEYYLGNKNNDASLKLDNFLRKNIKKPKF